MLERGRTFVNWTPGHTERASRILADLSPDPHTIDLGSLVVVTPGTRAARTMIATLIDTASARAKPLIPPVFITPSEIPTLCLRSRIPNPADPISRRLVWIETLRSCDHAMLEPLVPMMPAQRDDPSWVSIAMWVQRTCENLGTQALTPDDVLDRGASVLRDSERARWSTLALLRREYLNALRSIGVVDEQAAAIDALMDDSELQSSQGMTPLSVVLLAVPELPALAVRAIHAVNANTHAIVYAPDDHASMFDDLGSIRTNDWLRASEAVRSDSIRFAQDPTQAARAALTHIAQSGCSLDDATVALADEKLLGSLEHQAAVFGPLSVHSPASRSADDSAPAQLLDRISTFANEPCPENAASLTLHPHFDRWLRSQATDTDEALRVIQQIRTDHLLTRGTTLPSGVSNSKAAQARACLSPMTALLKPLMDSTQDAPFSAWCKALREILARIYESVESNAQDAPQDDDAHALEVIAKTLDLGISAPASEGLVPYSLLFTVLKEQLSSSVLASPHRENSLESLGWLELLHDPSRVCAVLGMSDSCVPRTPPRDPLVTLAIREALGIPGADDAFARDIYIAKAVDQSRDACFISSRLGAGNEPEPVSRVLLHTDPLECARRVARSGGAPKASLKLRAAVTAGDTDRFLPSVRVLEGYTPPRSMNVTEFDSYLRSPAQWYFERRLKLSDPDPNPLEMDGRLAGNLAHDTLERFGKDTSVRDSTVEAEINEALQDHLADEIERAFSSRRPASVSLQCELLSNRLSRVARAQCVRRNEGWRITHTEFNSKDLDTPPKLLTISDPMELHARVDRIDVHETTNQWCVIDYKSGKHSEAEGAHRTKDGEWIKLQLPLYRHVIKALGYEGAPLLAFANIPRSGDEDVFSIADWSEDDLNDADARAVEIIDAIRELRPHDPLELGDHPPSRGVLGFLSAERFKLAGSQSRIDDAGDQSEDAS